LPGGYFFLALTPKKYVGILITDNERNGHYMSEIITALTGEDLTPKSINEGRNEFEKILIPAVKELTLPDIFCDNMLFEAEKPVIIWGLSPYKDKIEITLFDKNGVIVRTKITLPAADTSFVTEFEGAAPSFDEYTLEIKAGSDKKTVKNILFGRLYLAGGQSNMDMLVRDICRKEDILTAAPNRNIRIYNPAVNPCDENECSLSPVFAPKLGGPWVIADNPEALKDVTAVGLVFAKGMFEKLNSEGGQVPVGILSTSRGGTVIETWMSQSAIKADPELKAGMLENRVYAIENDAEAVEELKKQGHNNTTVLYNMKISPLTNMNISGLIWYQGESQVGKSMKLFIKELDAFIRELSRRFRYRECLLPAVLINITPFPYDELYENPELATGGAKVNETFNEFAKLHAANIASMPTYDFSLRCDGTETWDPHPIHPSDKIPLAERAVEVFWGLMHDNLVPYIVFFKIDGAKVIAEFTNTYGGLETKNNEPVKGFRVCGADRKFYEAEAVITDKNKVSVSSADVPNPAAMSYAFCNMNNEANLINSRGIPVQIFRTDKEECLKP